MSKTYVKSPSMHSVQVAPYAVVAGAGMLVGSIFGIATADIANGGTGEIETVGVHKITGASILSTDAWTEGVKLYWDNTNKRITTTSTSNLRIGTAAEAKANPSSIGVVRLDGTVTSATT